MMRSHTMAVWLVLTFTGCSRGHGEWWKSGDAACPNDGKLQVRRASKSYYYCMFHPPLYDVVTGPRPRLNGAVVHGPFTSLHENGNVAVSGQFLYGAVDGKWTRFYNTGDKEAEGRFEARLAEAKPNNPYDEYESVIVEKTRAWSETGEEVDLPGGILRDVLPDESRWNGPKE